MARKAAEVVAGKAIESRIYTIRGERVMLDCDLAELYGVETRSLNQAVRRHVRRFPADFMFTLSKDEVTHLRSQFVISGSWGGARYPPQAFTEQGVAMLSAVLNSEHHLLEHRNHAGLHQAAHDAQPHREAGSKAGSTGRTVRRVVQSGV